MRFLRWCVARIRERLELEDVLVLLMPLLVLRAQRSEVLQGLEQTYAGYGPLHWTRLLVFCLVAGSFWYALSSRLVPEEDPLAPEGLDWDQVHVYTAWLGVLLGIPLLFVLLANGDTGVIYVYGALFAAVSFGALMWSLGPRAEVVDVERRRRRMLPFLVISTWYTTDSLVGSYLYDPHHVSLIVEPLRAFDPFGLAVGLIEAGFVACLFVVPYHLLVIFPRFIAGDVEPPLVWMERFAWFVASAVFGLVWAGVEVAWMGGV